MIGQPYIYDPFIECMPRHQLRDVQNQRLERVVQRCYEKMEMYRLKFDEVGLNPHEIKNVEDLPKIPFTHKEDLRKRFPLNGLLAVPRSEVLRYHMTTGTTGKPTVSPLTQGDVYRAEVALAKTATCIGLGPGDLILVMFGYGLFAGAVLGQPAYERLLGASVIPAGAALPSATQLELIADFHPTAVAATPSFLLHIIEVARSKGIELDKMGVKGFLTGAEASSEGTRKRIAEGFGASVYSDVYGMCELGPHFSCECQEHDGYHFMEEAFIPEIVDPNTGKPLSPGERGVLVVTCLMKEAMPLLRYWTNDITSLIDRPCACGRTHMRIERIVGRADDMVKVKGVNVFPSQVESVIRGVPEVGGSEYLILVDRSETAVDSMTVRIESEDKSSPVVQKLKDEFQKVFLGSNFKVELVDLGTLPRHSHKAKRLVDSRKL